MYGIIDSRIIWNGVLLMYLSMAGKSMVIKVSEWDKKKHKPKTQTYVLGKSVSESLKKWNELQKQKIAKLAKENSALIEESEKDYWQGIAIMKKNAGIFEAQVVARALENLADMEHYKELARALERARKVIEKRQGEKPGQVSLFDNEQVRLTATTIGSLAKWIQGQGIEVLVNVPVVKQRK